MKFVKSKLDQKPPNAITINKPNPKHLKRLKKKKQKISKPPKQFLKYAGAKTFQKSKTIHKISKNA